MSGSGPAGTRNACEWGANTRTISAHDGTVFELSLAEEAVYELKRVKGRNFQTVDRNGFMYAFPRTSTMARLRKVNSYFVMQSFRCCHATDPIVLQKRPIHLCLRKSYTVAMATVIAVSRLHKQAIYRELYDWLRISQTSADKNLLCTFRSKCAIFLECRYWTPLRICLMNSVASSSLSDSFWARKSKSSPPETLKKWHFVWLVPSGLPV